MDMVSMGVTPIAFSMSVIVSHELQWVESMQNYGSYYLSDY